MIPMEAWGNLAAVFAFAVFKAGVPFPIPTLFIETYRFEFNCIFPLLQRRCGDVRIVAEDDNPIFLDDGLQPFSLGFERLQRVKVVGHDPRESKMVTSRKKIGYEENGFAASADFNGLNVGVVAGNAYR